MDRIYPTLAGCIPLQRRSSRQCLSCITRSGCACDPLVESAEHFQQLHRMEVSFPARHIRLQSRSTTSGNLCPERRVIPRMHSLNALQYLSRAIAHLIRSPVRPASFATAVLTSLTSYEVSRRVYVSHPAPVRQHDDRTRIHCSHTTRCSVGSSVCRLRMLSGITRCSARIEIG
ncbi:hypothetical protein BamMEX5DRAFT_2242 [Burkholderia ambifaria MEX-5]|uniref:Uncharacterized protein n=1 Tax=Burkholderia ambifaria MEX-5 TaxID=396597 RepID=B1T376_9BURK|nr:hypothetical protein BamMEX5DRAFT_2242 [Burkholderia ambifaria MEX-5]